MTLDRAAAVANSVLHSDRKGVRREDVDVTANPVALREMRALSGQTERPVIIIDGKVIVGCEPAVVESLVPSRFLERGRR